MNKFTGKAIVTYGRSLITLTIAHSLAKRGIEVVTCDSVGLTATSFSKFVSDSFIHVDQGEGEDVYIASLIENIKQHKPSGNEPYILIPAFRDARLLAKHADKLSELIQLAAPSFSAIDAIDPKHHLLQTLKHHDVPHPRTFHPQSEQELDQCLSQLSFPALIKAVDEVGGRGIDFYDSREGMKDEAQARLVSENPPPILQEAVDGEDYCFCALYLEGELKAHMAYRNVQNLPLEGGSGAMRETVDDTPFIKSSNTLMKSLKWTGVVEIDYRWTGENSDPAYLIEINPRFWAGLFQSVESDVDFPWLLFHLYAYGRIPPVHEADVGTRTKLPGLWVAGAIKEAFESEGDTEAAKAAFESAKQDAREGDWSSAWKNLGHALSEALSFDDALEIFREKNAQAKTAKSELAFTEDPRTSLGVLFILSSLYRTGKLPPEVKF